MYLKKEHLYEDNEPYVLKPGPEGYVPPAAASMGITLPDPGEGLLYGRRVPEEQVMEEVAKQLLTRKNPTVFPGPLVLWAWNPHVNGKAESVMEIARAVPDCMIIPMPDYRPKYPKVDPEEAINPNHPNLTIWHNKIEVCVFVGVHCHYANLALKMIRAGTNCLTIALCAEQGHEDAMLSIRDCDDVKLRKIAGVITRAREKMGIPPPSRPPLLGGKRDLSKELAKRKAAHLNDGRAGQQGVPVAPGQTVAPGHKTGA